MAQKQNNKKLMTFTKWGKWCDVLYAKLCSKLFLVIKYCESVLLCCGGHTKSRWIKCSEKLFRNLLQHIKIKAYDIGQSVGWSLSVPICTFGAHWYYGESSSVLVARKSTPNPMKILTLIGKNNRPVFHRSNKRRRIEINIKQGSKQCDQI